MHNVNTVIIGAGPAGMAAAVQLRRAGVDFIILEKGGVGGLLLNANLVENYPGFPEGITGVELVGRFLDHLRALDISVIIDEVVRAERADGVFSTRTASGREIISKNLIVSSGTTAKRLDAPAEVCYEVYPLRSLSGKKVAVIGSGDAAFDYALNLAGRGNKVQIFMRGDRPKCLPLLAERAVRAGVEIVANCESPTCLSSPRKRASPPLAEGSPDLIIAAIGRDPEAGFLSEELKKSLESGVGIPGLYFAGDVKNGRMRYASTAVADGVYCANNIYIGA